MITIDPGATYLTNNLLFSRVYPDAYTYNGAAEKLSFAFWLPFFIPSSWVDNVAYAFVDFSKKNGLTPLVLETWMEKSTLGNKVTVYYTYHASPFAFTPVIIIAILAVAGISVALLWYKTINMTWKAYNSTIETSNERDEIATDYYEAALEANKAGDYNSAQKLFDQAQLIRNEANAIRATAKPPPEITLPGLPSIGWKEVALAAGALGLGFIIMKKI